jgi:nicotinamidase/pyrazinamidase
MEPVGFEARDGLLLVDPQNDFCPGGSLPVPEGAAVMPVLNRWAAAAHAAGVPIYVSRDWHPPHTTHFLAFGGVWPPHCVMHTHGAEFHPELRIPSGATLLSKGMGETEDAYSAFQARDDAGTRLGELLQRDGVGHLYVMGLATDYCVKASAIDGVAAGLRVTLVPEGVRAVNVQPEDGAAALGAMRDAGVEVLETRA